VSTAKTTHADAQRRAVKIDFENQNIIPVDTFRTKSVAPDLLQLLKSIHLDFRGEDERQDGRNVVPA